MIEHLWHLHILSGRVPIKYLIVIFIVDTKQMGNVEPYWVLQIQQLHLMEVVSEVVPGVFKSCPLAKGHISDLEKETETDNVKCFTKNEVNLNQNRLAEMF